MEILRFEDADGNAFPRRGSFLTPQTRRFCESALVPCKESDVGKFMAGLKHGVGGAAARVLSRAFGAADTRARQSAANWSIGFTHDQFEDAMHGRRVDAIVLEQAGVKIGVYDVPEDSVVIGSKHAAMFMKAADFKAHRNIVTGDIIQPANVTSAPRLVAA